MLSSQAGIGVRASMKDTGTSHSSPSYPRRLPARATDIYRIFVDSLCEDADARPIAEAIMSLWQTLRLETVSKGIKTAEQVAFLHGTACDLAWDLRDGQPVAMEDSERQVERRPLAAVP